MSLLPIEASRPSRTHPATKVTPFACFVTFVALLIPSARVVAAEKKPARPVHPVVPGFARLYDRPDADLVAGGRVLLSELGCIKCHADGRRSAGKQAPVLDHVGRRVRPGWLRRFLANPHREKPGTTMPDLFADDGPETKATVEALVHFLAATGSLPVEMASSDAVGRGEKLFHQVGCIACHQPRRPGIDPLPTSVPLGNPVDKYSLGSLTGFLKNPHAVRPSGRMPSLNLNDKEARDLASWFFRDLQLPPNLAWRYYEGGWPKLPDFGKLKPKASGKTAGFNLNVAPRKNNFGMRFTGFLQLAQAGRYTFHLGSDDGSRLVIDDKPVVDVDGIHPYQQRSAAVELAAGPHSIQVDFFQAGGEWVLKLQFEGPGVSRRDAASAISIDRQPQPPPPGKAERPFKLDPDLVPKGRLLFTRLGCAACHAMSVAGKRLASENKPLPLELLKAGQGCLAARPAGVPDFGLSDRQRSALAAAIAAPASKLSPAERIGGTLATMNCYACHARDKIGGVERPRNPLFVTTIPEMGDEGRVPPLLDKVGDKLNDAWLKQVLANGADDRPYMLTRMPKFGIENVGHLVDDFGRADRRADRFELDIEFALHRVRSAGRRLAGDKALACIKCHYFGKYKATGIQSLDMLTMTRRLRKSWFIRYMLDPQAYRPGTRMPAGWPRGQSQFPDLLLGDAVHQIAAIWDYLADGGKAGLPRGLIRNPIELVPTGEPIIYRNFISGLSPRGIAVGYPERANLGFDAEQMNLRMIWHNEFIDAQLHWNGRGSGFQMPLGDHRMALVGGVPFARLATAEAAWPTAAARDQGYRFGGYRLDPDRRPGFRYKLGDLVIEDFPRPVRTRREPDLERTLTLTRSSVDPPGPLWYRVASGKSIEPLAEGWWMVDGALRVRVTTPDGTRAIRRNRPGGRELLLPVRFQDGRATIVHRYSW